jgi:hypothetical protein
MTTHATQLYGGYPDCWASCACGWRSTHEYGFYDVIEQVEAHTKTALAQV